MHAKVIIQSFVVVVILLVDAKTSQATLSTVKRREFPHALNVPGYISPIRFARSIRYGRCLLLLSLAGSDGWGGATRRGR